MQTRLDHVPDEITDVQPRIARAEQIEIKQPQPSGKLVHASNAILPYPSPLPLRGREGELFAAAKAPALALGR